MAVVVNKGTFVKSTGGAPVAQTIDTGSGEDIKFLKLFAVKATATGFAGKDVSGSKGFSDGTTEKSIGWFSEDLLLAKSNTASCSGDKILCFVDGSAIITAEADVTFGTGIDAGKFTVTWTTNDTDADIIHYEAYTGDSITDVKVGEFSSNTATGNQAVTGVGFIGEYLSLMSASNISTTMTTVNTRSAFGQAVSSSARNTWCFFYRDGQNANKDSDSQVTDRCLRTLQSGGMNSGQIDGDWDFVSFDADGFTLNVVTAPSNADKIFYAVLNGGEYDVGSFNQPIITGTDTITVGFKPKGISLSSWNKVASINPAVDSSPIKGSYGAGTESVEGGIWFEHDNQGDGVGQLEDINTYTDKVIKLATATSTIDAEADFNSTTATAFVLDWTTADATAREILYFAIGQVEETFDKDFTVDAKLSALEEFTVDAFIQALDQEETFLVDAFLQATFDKDFTVDSRLVNRIDEDFFVDAFLQATQVFNFTSDALIQGVITKFFLSDAFVQDVFDEDFIVDAIAQATFDNDFTVNSIVVNRIDETFIVDGFPQAKTDKTFLVNAILSGLEEFTVDGFVTTEGTKNFIVNAFVQELDQEKTFLVGVCIGVPAITVRQGTLIKDTGGAPVSQTIDTGTNVEIKFIKLSSTRQTSEGFEHITLTISEGFSDGTNSRAISFMSEEGVDPTNTGSRYANKGLTFIDSSLSTIAECDVSFGIGVDAGKFTLTWTTNDATASIIHFVTYGDGKETLSANVGTFTSNTVTGNQSIIGVGFKGEMSLFLTNNDDVVAPNTVSDGGMCVGHAMSPSKRNTLTFLGRDAQGMNNKNNTTQRTDLALRTLAPTGMSVGNTDGDYDFVSFDADGFTLNVIDAPLSATQIFYAVLKGGNYDVGNFDQPISNGTQEITTGFEPIHTSFRSWNEVADIAIKKNVGVMKFTSSGAKDDKDIVSEGGYWFDSDTSSLPVDNDVNTFTDRAILLATGGVNPSPSTVDAEANYESSNDESFTLDWTVTDATAREILYWTIGEAPTEGFTVDAILSALAEFTVDGVIVRNALFDIDARLSALAEFEIDARLAQRETFTIDAVVVRNELFDVDGRLAQRELFEVDAVIVRNELFDVDARLSALAEFEIDARLSALAEFEIDSVIVRNTFFDIDAVIVRNELFDINAVVVDRFDKDFTVDGFPQQTQVFNFTVDGFIEQTPEEFFLIDAFIRDTFDEDFTVDSRIAVRELFTVDARLSGIEEFTIDARLSALAEFTVDGRVAQRELFEIDAVIVRNELFDVDARIAVRELFEVDAVIVRNELFDVDARLSALAEFTVDARLSALAEFTVDSVIVRNALFDIDAVIVRNELFTVDGRVAVRELFTVDGRVAVRELFTVDAELRPIQEFTVDSFIQVLDQEETFLVDARLKALTSVLVIVDAFVQKLNQEETFLIDAFIEDTFTETFLVDARLKGVQTETFLVDTFIQDTADEDFTIDAFIKALNQEETFLVDAQLANIIAETFLVDGLTQATQAETFDVDSRLAQRAEKDFTVDAKIAFRKDFTVDATLSPRELFTVDAFTKATQTKTFSVDSVLTVAGQKIFTVDALIQNTFTETVQVDAHVRAVVQETFTVDTFVRDTFTETFTIDARTEELNSETFDVDAIIKALNTDKTFIVDTFTQETESPKAFTVDSFIQKTQTETTQVDAKVRDVIEETFIIDAFIQDTFTKTFSVDSILTVAGQVVFTVDTLTQTSNIDKTFTVEAKIQVEQIRPFQIDAVVTGAQAKTFTVDAQIFLPTLANFTIDSFLVQPVSLLEFTVDARIEELTTQAFTIDSILIGAGQKVFTVDGLTLGTQTEDFTVSAIIRNVNQEIFDIDALIQLTGDVLCAGQSGVIFNDDITGDTGWTVTGTQILVDDPSFPNVIRMECLQSFFAVGTEQAVKALDSTIINFKAQDLVFDFDHLQIFECTGGFRGNGLIELSETSSITASLEPAPSQAYIRYRIISSGPQPTHFARLEISDGTTSLVSSSFQLTNNATRFVRISIVNNGSDARIEFFGSPSRTVPISSIPDTDISSLTGKSIGFVQVANLGGGGGLRKLRGEFDNLLVTASRLCPEFTVDSVLKGEIEKEFTVDAQIVTINRFTIDAVISGLNQEETFLVDAFIGTPEVTFTIDALLKAQGKFTVDAFIQRTGDQLCDPSQITSFPDFSDDFSSYANQTEADDSWLPRGTDIRVNFNNDLIDWDFRRFGQFGNRACSFDLNSIGIFPSDTQWTLRWKMTIDTVTQTQSGQNFGDVGLYDGDSFDSSDVAQDFITVRFLRSTLASENNAYIASGNDVTPESDIFGDDEFTNDNAVGTLFYELKRTSATTYEATSFSDADYTQVIENVQSSCSSSIVNLRYIKVQGRQNIAGGGLFDGTLDDIEFWNETSDVTISACPRVSVDAIVKELNQEVLFTIDAQIIRAVQYDVDAKLSLQVVEPFTIDARIAVRELFDIDATLRNRFDEQFLIDGSTLGTVEKDFTIDGILIVFPSGLILIDSIIQAQDNDKTFTVDSQLFKAGTDFDFTVDTFILRTGEQLCDPSQITSFPDFTEDFSTYTNQTEADTAWVPQDISTAQVDITNDVLGVIQVSDTSNDANIFSNGLSPDSNEWVLRWKLVISSITFTAGGTCEGFFGWSAGGSVGGSSNQKSIGVQMRFGTDINDSQFRVNISNAINPIFPPQPGGNMSTPPDVGTYYFEMIRTGPLGMDVNIYSDANFTDLIESSTFSLGFFGSTPSGLGYKNNQLTNTGSIDYTIDDIQFWNGISDVSISSCPRFNVDAVIQTPTIDKEFIVDAVIKTLGENGTCNFFPGTNLAIDTGLEQFIGPIQPAHEGLVEQLVGQEVTLSNQQVRSVTILLRSSNFPNEITTNMPINAEVWSDVVLGNFGGETTEAVSNTGINAINTSGDLPPGDWIEVKFTFDINTTPFLTGDFVVGYRSLSSVFSPAGVGTAIPVISNSNVIPGSAVHRKGANSTLGDLDKWIFLTEDQKDMVIQLEVVNGDEIILGVGKQCPLVDAVLDPSPNKFEIDSIITDRFQRDFTIDTVLFPFPVPFTVDGILVGTTLSFTVDAVLVPEPKTFTVDGIILVVPGFVFNIDAILQPFIEFEVDALVQALETKSPKFNLNALLVVEDREIDFTVDGSTKFFDRVAPFIVDAQVIFFPSQLPQVDGIIKELGALQPFTVDAFIQQLDFNFVRSIDALIQKQDNKPFIVDTFLVQDLTENFTIDARLSVKAPPFLFTVDGLMLLENHRWQTDALLQTTNQTQFSVDLLIVALPQKLFLVDASTLGTIDETFIIDGLIEIEAQEPFLVDARILQINTVDFTVDARIFGVGLIQDFTVDSSLVRVGEFLLDSFVQALGDGILGNGNNGSTNANNTTNPFISQTTDDNTITLPIGTLVGQRLRLPTAPVRVDDYTFVIHRAGTAGTPTGTLTGKIYKNSIGGNSISGADLIATSDNVVSLSSITTSSSGQNVQFTFTNPPEITVDDNVFIGFDIAGSNEQMFLHTESTGTAIAGGDVNIESTGTWGVDLGVDAVLTINIDTEPRQRASALMNAFVGRFIREIIGVDALIKSIGGESGSDVPAEFTVDAKVAFVKEAGFTVDTQLIGSQDFTVSAFVGDTLFVTLEVESVIVENNSNEGVESVIVENNSDEGVESVIGQGD
jgi:hypothetical protein